MRVAQEKVRMFMEWIGEQTADKPALVDGDTCERRYELIKEELNEYREANEKGDLVAVGDALGDLLYTVVGLAVLHGIDAQPVFDEVHISNMTKEPEDSYKKCRKGPAFKAPRIAELLLIQATGVAAAQEVA